MPLYTYICEDCQCAQEHITQYDKRNEPTHCLCGGQMKRQGVEQFALGQPAYQMGVVLDDGTRIPGHFGRDAKRHRKKSNAAKP